MAKPYYVQVSFPSDVGATFGGVSRAPLALISAGLSAKMYEAGYEGMSENALPDGPAIWRSSPFDPSTGARQEAEVLRVNQELKLSVEKSLLFYQEDTDIWPVKSTASGHRDGRLMPPFHLILGGDCSMTPAVMSAFVTAFPQSKIGLIYVDAHADAFVPNQPGTTGVLAAMTLTHLTLRPGCLQSMKVFSRPDGTALVNADNLVLFGLSATEPSNTQEQLGWILDQNFRTFTAAGVKQDPTSKATEALKWLESRVDMILVHFDLDTVDAGDFPLGNIPTWTGLKFEEVMAAVKVFIGSEKTVALTLAEINPDRDAELSMSSRLVAEVADGMKMRVKK